MCRSILIITSKGLKPGDVKVNAIMDFLVPRNVHEIRRFVGLASNFRRFICNFAKLITPLNDLLKSDKPFFWDERQTEAYEL